MVKDKYKPDDSDFRVEEEAMLRELFDEGEIDSDDFVRFGPPNASRMFLREEITSDSRPYRYPDDVEEKPEKVRELYSEYSE